MRPPVFRVHAKDADASAGRVVWDPAKSLWHAALAISAIVLVPFTTSIGAVLVFLTLTYATLLFGHSVGMHRKLIHKSFVSGNSPAFFRCRI